MPINIGSEMALPMEQIIGGPLQAVIKAQALAASTTAEFINSVGLETKTVGTETKTVARTVSFSFDRKKVNPTDTDNPTTETVVLNVPLLTIIPVPYIRVEEATIDFECKVASTTVNQSNTQFGVSTSASGGFFGAKFSVNASFSHQRQYKDEVTRSATLTVHVKAVQDEMPGGLAKILEILQTAIVDAPEEA